MAEGLTDCCECNEGIVDRYCVFPPLEIGEQAGGKEDEDNHGWHEVECDLTNEIKLHWNPVPVCRHLILLVAIVESDEL